MLHCIALGLPQIPYQSIIRVPTTGVRITDVMAFNCKPGTIRKEPTGRRFYGTNFLEFNMDDSKL